MLTGQRGPGGRVLPAAGPTLNLTSERGESALVGHAEDEPLLVLVVDVVRRDGHQAGALSLQGRRRRLGAPDGTAANRASVTSSQIFGYRYHLLKGRGRGASGHQFPPHTAPTLQSGGLLAFLNSTTEC